MKKLIYFCAFVALGYFASGNAYSQTTVIIGGGDEGERWVCCQVHHNEICYDKYGFSYDNSERREGVPTCTIFPQ